MIEEQQQDNTPSSEPRRDYFGRIYLLLVLVMLGLLALYVVPSQIGSWWDIKPIDMLSDLRMPAEADTLALDPLIAEQDGVDSLPKPQPKRVQEVQRRKHDKIYEQIVTSSVSQDEARPIGVVDYSAERTGLKHFFSQLRKRSSLGRPVRIAVLGDSFVEADIFTDAVRLGLQERFGGGGVGLLGLSSTVAGYRQSVRHEQRGWQESTLLEKKGRKYTMLGRIFEPKAGASASYKVPSGGRAFDEVTLYYYSPSAISLEVEAGGEAQTARLEAADSPIARGSLYTGSSIEQVRLSLLDGASGLVSYGLALEQREGISLDNMSLRGSSGLHLGGLDTELGKAFAELRPYDLIIVQYGLNVANAKQTNYKGYASSLRKSILHLRAIYPEADVMILGVSDRAQRSGGELRTMRAIELLDAEQRAVAESLGVTYFSLLEAMRSLGGVVEMSKRGDTSKDYTHLSHKGGRRLATLFVDALMLEKDYYDKIHH